MKCTGYVTPVLLIALAMPIALFMSPGEFFRFARKAPIAIVSMIYTLKTTESGEREMESERLYYPTSPMFIDDLSSEILKNKIEEVTFQGKDRGGRTLKLYGWYVPAEKGKPTILYSSGNRAPITRIERYELLVKNGYGFLAYEYPGYGKSKGEPSEESLYASIRLASNFLENEKGVDNTKQILLGISLGGAVSVDLASNGDFKALVLGATFTSIPEVFYHRREGVPRWWFPVSHRLHQRFDSLSKINRVRCPLLIVHGKDDSSIPIEMGRKLFDAAEQVPSKQFIERPGEGHETFQLEAVNQILDFLEDLKPAPS